MTKLTMPKVKMSITSIVAWIVFFMLVVLGIVLYRFFFPKYEQADLYGRRIENIYEVSQTDFNELEAYFKTPEFVNSVSFDVKGAMVYVLVDVSDVTHQEVKDAYSLSLEEATVALNVIKEYDVNVTVINESEVESEDGKLYFPLAGYKYKNHRIFSWQTKNVWEFVDPNAQHEEAEEDSEENSEEDNG